MFADSLLSFFLDLCFSARWLTAFRCCQLKQVLGGSFVGNYGAYCWEVVNMGFV